MRIALYQPDIPQNTGTILRLGACLGVPVDIIEPCGFPLSDASLKRAGMDYLDHATWTRHTDFNAFLQAQQDNSRQIVLLTTRAETTHMEHTFTTTQTLLLGRESAGVPQAVHERADARITIPMVTGMRSLNVAMATAIVIGEALRQTNAFPHPSK